MYVKYLDSVIKQCLVYKNASCLIFYFPCSRKNFGMSVVNVRVCPAILYTTNVSRTSESISRYNSKYLERIQYEAAPVYTRECETVGGNNFCGFLELA